TARQLIGAQANALPRGVGVLPAKGFQIGHRHIRVAAIVSGLRSRAVTRSPSPFAVGAIVRALVLYDTCGERVVYFAIWHLCRDGDGSRSAVARVLVGVGDARLTAPAVILDERATPDVFGAALGALGCALLLRGNLAQLLSYVLICADACNEFIEP